MQNATLIHSFLIIMKIASGGTNQYDMGQWVSPLPSVESETFQYGITTPYNQHGNEPYKNFFNFFDSKNASKISKFETPKTLTRSL
jgi:hypothetical protein